ncbi:MAG: hypothetical protein RRA60_08205 [Chlorobiota bacterium]|nr:hypothetical protein [Chlorobiota bacterium]
MRLYSERTRWISLLMLLAAWLQLTVASVAVVVCCPAAAEEPCCCVAEVACCAEEGAAEELGAQEQGAPADLAAQPCPMNCCWESTPVALPLSSGPVLQPLPLVHGTGSTLTLAVSEPTPVLLLHYEALRTPLRQHLRCHVLRC